MIGLDTNVLVRYLVRDDPIQFGKAIDLIEGRLSVDEPGFVSVVAMAELVWVLDRAYGFSDSEIAAAIERMLQADALMVESETEVFTAMIALREGRGSFSDALIGALGGKAGCAHTLTFDRKALRLPGFALI
ncbi:MAG TPA: type II toxin-antitoxin system VapC family toxin [Stellaceae bacterium]|jgi:predicted nucleic-acid-binding protein|nr:type II toxin-antitoxin system VapC family toxin [Stellaceae bacterium]